MSVELIGKAPGSPLRGREPGRSETASRASRFTDPSPPSPGEDKGPAFPTLPRAEAGRLPSLLDTREQPAQTEERAKRRLDKRARSKLETIAAGQRALRTGKLAGVDLDAVGLYAHPVLENWVRRLMGCGQRAVHRWCPDDDHHVITVDCCHVPACPHEEARSAKRWSMRGEQMMKQLPSGERWGKVRERLKAAGVVLPERQPCPEERMGWKMLTVATRKAHSIVEDVEKQIRFRKRLVRFLARRFGLVAAFIAVEVGSGGNAHFHALVYSPYVPRSELQHWLQSQDCDVSGCTHKPGDRSCGGSWSVDIRACYDPREALKYACSPDAKHGGDRDAFAEIRLLTYLVLYKRHRVETYGLARPGFWKTVDQVDTYLELGICPYCGQEMVIIQIGSLLSSFHSWISGETSGPRSPPVFQAFPEQTAR